MSEKSELHKEYVLQLESELHELETREESATRRMQMLVYPAMVAFIILAAYGFYLVQSLTADVHRMADSVRIMSESVDKSMTVISENTSNMSNKMASLVTSTHEMSGSMTTLVDTTGNMSGSVGNMAGRVDGMATSTGDMQQDMWSLNQNISTPLSMFNKFIPWNNNSNGRFRGSQPRPPVGYYPQYQVPPPVVAQPAQQVQIPTN